MIIALQSSNDLKTSQQRSRESIDHLLLLSSALKKKHFTLNVDSIEGTNTVSTDAQRLTDKKRARPAGGE